MADGLKYETNDIKDVINLIKQTKAKEIKVERDFDIDISSSYVRKIIKAYNNQKLNVFDRANFVPIHTHLDVKLLYVETLPRVLKHYNEKLLSNHYGFNKKELLSFNRIDLRPIFHCEPDKTSVLPNFEDYTVLQRKFIKENGKLFSALPCYEKGVIQINKDRYLYWDIKDISIPNNEFTVFIQDYIYEDNYWTVGVSMTAVIRPGDGLSVKEVVDITILETTSYLDIYNLIPDSELEFSDFEKLIFDCCKDISRQTYADMKRKNLDVFSSMCYIFVYCIVTTNYMLSQHKPTRGKRPSGKRNKKTIVINNGNQPTKLFRTVGPIHFISEKPPKKPSNETVIHYKTASWSRRAHTRHYKNGKTVFVKESKPHRKCLQQNDNSPQVIIKVTNGKE